MHNQVIADIEIEDQRIEYYSSVIIRQQFNSHHEFAIRIRYDVLGKADSFSLSNAQKMIGKAAVIKLRYANRGELAYEFRGLVCEISLEQSENFTSELVIKGYSPTIVLENGSHFSSFYKKSLADIVRQVTGTLSNLNCRVNTEPEYKPEIEYFCQYRESSFHFLNRLSADFGEWCYYDGKELFFGKPSAPPETEITYGEDVHNIQILLRVMPMKFSSYSYLSKDDKVICADSPSALEGMNEYAQFVMSESDKLFSEPTHYPLRQRVSSKSELDEFIKKEKAAIAARLQILSGTSDNPALFIGTIADVKYSRFENSSIVKEDYGKFVLTSVEHCITENGKYFNRFEGIPSGIGAVPVQNIIMPVAESQLATVTDNKDPDNMGRVRVQMFWQQAVNEKTGWCRVMTPDAGGGKDGAKNRGMVCIPETGDQVIVNFRHNDPNNPYIDGSMFHGKSGGGGGEGNKSKSLTSLSGSKVSMDGDAISIIDAAGNSILFDGGGKIDIKCSSSISLTVGGSSITMDSGGKIAITGSEITISGSTKAIMKSTASFTAEANKATTKGDTVEVKGDTTVDIHGGSSALLKSDTKLDLGSPTTTVQGDSNLKLKSTGSVDIDGTATTNVKGGCVNLN